MMGLASEPRSGPLPPGPADRKRVEWGDLWARSVSAIVLMALALGATLLDGRAFDLFWLIAGLAILWEWQTMVGGPRRTGRLLAGGFAVCAATLLTAGRMPGLSLLALGAGASAIAVVASPGLRSVSAAGALYAGVPVVAVVILRHSVPYGLAAILWLFAVVWGTDCMAYFGGRLIGGPKLSPRFSPSKTWSGFGIGVTCGSLFGLMASPSPTSVGPMVLLGLAGGAFAQAGDLFESALKRRFGVKDASQLIPGHGGVMDRLDGFVACSIFAAAVGLWRFGADAAGLGLFQW